MSDQIDPATAPLDPVRWMIVEIFGHRQHAGRCFSEERFGVQGVRIDEPSLAFGSTEPGEIRWTTHWYAGAAVFSVQETTEAAVMRRAGVKPPPAIRADAGHPLLEASDGPICDICGERIPASDCGRDGCPVMPF